MELGISPQKVQVRSGLYQERVEEEGEKEEEEGRKRVRHVYTRKQTLHLEYIFRTHIYPDTYTRNKLAVELGISPQKVQVRYIRNKLAVELGISPQKVLVRYIRNKLAVELGISPQKVQVRSGLYQERVEEEGEKEEEEEEEGRKRVRHVYTRKQTLQLENIFRTEIYPDTYIRNKLAVELGISPQKVLVRYIRNKLAVELGISPQKVLVRYIRNKLAVELGISPQKVQVRSGLLVGPLHQKQTGGGIGNFPTKSSGPLHQKQTGGGIGNFPTKSSGPFRTIPREGGGGGGEGRGRRGGREKEGSTRLHAEADPPFRIYFSYTYIS